MTDQASGSAIGGMQGLLRERAYDDLWRWVVFTALTIFGGVIL